MKLHVEWGRPIQLRDGSSMNMIYTVDLSKLPQGPGVYIFARRWGSGFEALYVGKAGDIRSRAKTQLNNLLLMQHLRHARAGKRVILAGRFDGKPGQRLDKSLVLIERALIRYYLSEGHDLVNRQGTRLRYHEVISVGKQPRRFLPSPMYLERTKDG